MFATTPLPDISIDTKPTYILAGLGFNLGLGYVKTKSTLIDYPTKNEESEFDLSILFLSPSIFYVWGNKLLGKNGDFSFKIGGIAYVPIVNNVSITRTNTKETSGYDIAASGGSTILEIDWFYMFIKAEGAKIKFKTKFNGIDEDQLETTIAKVKFGYNYYF